jgi:DNA mismatch repair protein MLH1
MTRRDMLAEYFSVRVSSEGMVESLPLLLRDYTPNLDKLPSFLMRLGPQVRLTILNLLLGSLRYCDSQVNWSSEKDCFDSFLRELAYFYVPGPLVPAPVLSSSVPRDEEKAERWQIQHVLFPTMRRYLITPKSLLDRDVVQVASLPDLYRVFERC